MYDFDLYETSLRSGPDCSQVVSNVTNYIEMAINGSLTTDDKAYVYSIFGGQDLPVDDFMGFVADAFAGSVQYGTRGKMCSVFNSVAFASVKE